MADRLPRAALLIALERRFDHASARTILADAVAGARVGDKDDYTVEEVSRLAWVLRTAERRVDPAAEALLEAVSIAASRGLGAPMVEPHPDADPADFAELDEDPDWERIDLAAIPALLQDIVSAAVQSHQAGLAGQAAMSKPPGAHNTEEPSA